MRYLLGSSEAIADRCPDAESLIAFSEGILSSEKYELIRAHLDSCSACSEIHRLLLRFEDAGALLSESDWHNAEKRLWNWMESFLPAGSAAAPAGQTHQAKLWEKFWEWIRIPQIGYGLAATTALALIAGTSLYRLYRTPAPAPVASVVPEQKISPLKTGPQPPPATEIGSSKAEEIRPGVSALLARNASHPKVAQQSNPTIEIGSSRSKEISDLTPTHAIAPQVPELTTIPVVPLLMMQLEVGTRMLVRVDSLLKTPAGNVKLRGALLQPVMQRGKEVLPANSTLVADCQASEREILLRIAEIRVQFAQSPSEHRAGITRYFLSPSEDQPNARAHLLHELSPGATVELQFVTSSSYLSEDRPMK